MKRRNFVKATTLTAFTIRSALANNNFSPTPDEVEGPFYPLAAQKDQDFDLTTIEGSTQSALGQHIFIKGRVIDTEGNSVENAIVDLWQANAAGRYSHPRDPNTAALDKNFQGWAIVLSGKNGEFKFKTVLPGAYPASNNWMRPPHIHFKVTKKGYSDLTTQMYFPEQSLNKEDRLLQRKSPEQQQLMVAEKCIDQANCYRFRIIIKKA